MPATTSIETRPFSQPIRCLWYGRLLGGSDGRVVLSSIGSASRGSDMWHALPLVGSSYLLVPGKTRLERQTLPLAGMRRALEAVPLRIGEIAWIDGAHADECTLSSSRARYKIRSEPCALT